MNESTPDTSSAAESTLAESVEHAVTPPVSVATRTVSTDGQDTENFIETYHAIAEWIRFADAKAAVVITVGGAMAGFLIPTINKIIEANEKSVHLIPNWQLCCVALFVLYILFFLLSSIAAFLCINPLRKKGKHPSLEHCSHFHPAAVSAHYDSDAVERFVDDCRSIGPAALKREVQAAILFDSHISSIKYGRVRQSLFFFGISVFFGFVYFLFTQL